MPRLYVLLLVAGCHRGASDGATCEAVGGTFQTIARGEIEGAKVDQATYRDVSDQIPAMRDALVAVCKDGGWSAQVRNCMAKAADHPALQACEAGLTDDQRRAIDKAAHDDVPDGR